MDQLLGMQQHGQRTKLDGKKQSMETARPAGVRTA
jgi:hypothetical protein